MQIAILGASSQISKGLIKLFAKKDHYHLQLFVRDKTVFNQWIKSQDINDNFRIHHFDEFNTNIHIDLIINCIGVGDPSKLVQLGSSLLETTNTFDDLALNYLNENPLTKYVFFSSGAVYGDIFSLPAEKDSKALIDLNFGNAADFYTLSKLYSEARHRALPNLNIVDLRVFNYISAEMDINGNFFISQALNCAINQKKFITDSSNIMRDYIGPEDLFYLIEAIIKVPKINDSFDCYSSKPADKFSILDLLHSEFNLSFVVESDANSDFIKNLKENYYSLNRKAENIGFQPIYTSLENIQKSIKDIIGLN